MKHRLMMRIPALIAALALCLGVAACGEELGEVSLDDPAIRAGEALSPDAAMPGAVAPMEEAWTAEDEIVPEPVEAIVEEQPEADLPMGEADASDAAALFGPLAEAGVSAPQGSDGTAPYLRLGLGEVYKLGFSGVTLYSDDTSVIAVDSKKSALAGVGLGSANVTASDGKGRTATARFEVLEAPSALSFPGSALTLGKGETRSVSVTLPEGTASARIAWSSSNKSVVKVDSAGKLTAKKTGSATITAKAFNGVKVKLRVQVKKAPTGLALSANKLALGLDETATLTARLSGGASRIAWKSSDESVVTVDDEGGLRAVGPGNAVVGARTFNGCQDTCKVLVLEGRSPTTLTLGVSKLTMGVKEQIRLVPALGEGESAWFTYSSSKKSVASVSSKGLVTAKKTGKAKITVKTHNGLKASVTVEVVKKPTKLKLSKKTLSLAVGQTQRLEATLPEGTASQLTWKSSDASVASVNAEGVVTALKPGKTTVAVQTYNNLIRKCTVTVTEATPEETPMTDDPTAAKLGARLRANSALGAKRAAIASVVELLVGAGFEPAFAAGVGANVYAEGTYGLFESSKYIKNYQKRPRYFCYLDGGEYYTRVNGEYTLTAVYLSKEEMATYSGKAEARLRFGEENYYRDNFSGKYVYEVDLKELEAFVNALAAGGWQGKFGVGLVQWTGARTRNLVALYRKHADASGNISAQQVAVAENEMILYDFKGDYAGVYTAWKQQNAAALACEEAARSAGSIVCTRYEIPVDKDAKAVTRGEKAKEIYRIMMGG